jgi:hypothetical protein
VMISRIISLHQRLLSDDLQDYLSTSKTVE